MAKTANSCWKEIYAEQNNCISVRTPIQAEQQVRKLLRETGQNYASEICKTFEDKASAREYETNLIERFRQIYGQGTLPGNKTN